MWNDVFISALNFSTLSYDTLVMMRSSTYTLTKRSEMLLARRYTLCSYSLWCKLSSLSVWSSFSF